MAWRCWRVLRCLPEDQQQPIHVTADSAVQENNIVTYRGNVLIVQGSIRIDADQVVIYHDKGKLQKAVATGKPAHFQEQPEADGGLITGSANTLILLQCRPARRAAAGRLRRAR